MPKTFLTPEQQIRQRYAWFELAGRLDNVSLACLRLAISRKTFYKWQRCCRSPKNVNFWTSSRPGRKEVKAGLTVSQRRPRKIGQASK